MGTAGVLRDCDATDHLRASFVRNGAHRPSFYARQVVFEHERHALRGIPCFGIGFADAFAQKRPDFTDDGFSGPSQTDRTQEMLRTVRYLGVASGLLLATFSIGCTRSVETSYAWAEGTGKLPPLHQRNMQESLTRLFGTPDQPRQMNPKGEVAEGAEPQLVDDIDPRRLRWGAEIYNLRCAGCHGISGDGQGPAAAYLQPKPRDYRRGIFKFTSTPIGSKPTRADLARTVRRGARGTSMPGFPWMPDEEVNAVLDYVITLSQRGEVETAIAQIADADFDEDQAIGLSEFTGALTPVRDGWAQARTQVIQPLTPEPPYTPESILAGRKIYLAENCAKCHGPQAKGQTEWLSPEFLAGQESLPAAERAQVNRDVWQQVAPAADLTARTLHGGRRSIDIYRRVHAGINGSPMPSFANTFAKEPDNIWHLVHYVRSIVEGGPADPEKAQNDGN